MTDFSALKNAVIDGDAKLTRLITDQFVAAGVDPQSILADALVPAMAVVGDRFECGEYFVPELLIAARAMKSALEPLRPLLAAAPGKVASYIPALARVAPAQFGIALRTCAGETAQAGDSAP